ncbi:hypothetical protein [Streptomyces sp. NPDC053048]|uniref:hypothetical protein n=1 Tax=Streptomyces sp. NPDC053048 TaxID=3365694 RepID=UPI0037CFD962
MAYWAPLAEGASSASWSVRAATGRRLAGAADVPEAAVVLHRLLLDEDTAVTQETAEALLERRDVCGVRLALTALTVADDDTADQLYDAIDTVCYRSEDDRAQLMALCSELASDADSAVGEQAAGVLRRWRST